MTETTPLNAPNQLPGPSVNNAPTTITILTTSQLRATAFIPGIYRTINTAFSSSHAARQHIYGKGPHSPRLSAAEEFLNHLQEDPETFVVLIHRPDTATNVLATVSCRLFRGPTEGEPEAFKRKYDEAPSPGEEWWELKLLAVDPECQKQGLAGFLMGLVESEVVRGFRAKQKKSKDSGREEDGAVRLKMLLTTVKQTQGEFYARKGYKTDYERARGGEYSNMTIIFMSKDLTPVRSELPGSDMGM